MYIEKINSPKDVKKLNLAELCVLADEVRAGILNRVSKHGGHVGPNLGFTEGTVALHYVFDAPTDKIVFDVSHQSYPHKMLTGRAQGFLDDEVYFSVSGYSSPLESPEYDNFEIGHTSTSVSLASGLQKARDIRGSKERIVVVIGDGSLSGGEAFEGLDVVAELGTGILIIVNDNEMSIAENHGGIYNNLRLLRQTQGKAECNLFRAIGLDYHYLEQGNDVEQLIKAFTALKDVTRPTVLHIHTEKGHGYAPAVSNKEAWHYKMPFDLETGELLPQNGGENAAVILGQWLLDRMKNDSQLVSIVSGVPMVVGWGPEQRRQAGAQLVDVGIAEEHAVAMASGIAKGGVRAVYNVTATFLQRAYDQIAQDLCVNGNPAVINVFGSSVFGMNDFTHICFFDIAMLSHIPNLVYLAPTTIEEMIAMENWAIAQTSVPVAIRVPACNAIHTSEPVDDSYDDLDKYKVMRSGSQVAVIAAGDFYQRGEEVVEQLKAEGVDATLINPRYLSGIDTACLDALKDSHLVVATIEDGTLDGGFGERISRYYGPTKMRVLNFGVKKQLYDRFKVDDLLRENHLTVPQIVSDIMATLADAKA